MAHLPAPATGLKSSHQRTFGSNKAHPSATAGRHRRTLAVTVPSAGGRAGAPHPRRRSARPRGVRAPHVPFGLRQED